MNFIAQETPEKLRGGFYTDPDITGFLTRWISVVGPRRVMEPSCGDGAFLEALQRVKCTSLQTVFACEINAAEATRTRERVAFNKSAHLDVHTGDFLRWFLFQGETAEPFDAVFGNPPFIRYQYLPEEQQFLAEKVFSRFGLSFTKHTNAWVPFVVASLALLRPGGRLAMVVPSEILHIPHAQSLRRFLAEHCTRILIIDPSDIWFGNTLQGTVLLLAEKKNSTTDKGLGVSILPFADRSRLLTDPEVLFQKAVFTNGATIEGKWMSVFLSKSERALVSELRTNKEVRQFSEVASVDVGIVTGANDFFLVPDNTVQEFELQEWAHPMFGRSDHVRGLVYSLADHQDNRTAGLPANFLWFPDDKPRALGSGAQEYLRQGLARNLHTRYKCKVRTPWYRVPSVYRAPVAMLKRAHHYPRLVLNSAEAYTTDTAYRIKPIGTTAAALVFSFVNSLTCLSAELEGRHYGGGVLELVPSEIERLLMPVIKTTSAQLKTADQAYRLAADDTAFLRAQDAVILAALGLSQEQIDTLHGAWARLRDRRHRIPATDGTTEHKD